MPQLDRQRILEQPALRSMLALQLQLAVHETFPLSILIAVCWKQEDEQINGGQILEPCPLYLVEVSLVHCSMNPMITCGSCHLCYEVAGLLLSFHSFHFISYSLGCGASSDSSDILASKLASHPFSLLQQVSSSVSRFRSRAVLKDLWLRPEEAPAIFKQAS